MSTPPKSYTLSEIITSLPSLAANHARTSQTWRTLNVRAQQAVAASNLSKASQDITPLGCFGDIVFPYRTMGAVTTLDLFGLDELIVFSFYWVNRYRYRNVADIGANLGIHSILMAKCGWDVIAYEPDPQHVKILHKNLALNKICNVRVVQAAVSDRPGTTEFVRVLGNTTSSHLIGAKDNAYGQLIRFPVRTETITSLMIKNDFIKVDAEGQERVIILATDSNHWMDTDMIVEIGSEKNAIAIYEHLKRIGVNSFAQKIGWAQVISLEDMPMNYKNGSLFITRKAAMSWSE